MRSIILPSRRLGYFLHVHPDMVAPGSSPAVREITVYPAYTSRRFMLSCRFYSTWCTGVV